MKANPAGEPADMVAEVHDETGDHDGPETDGQRDVIVGRLMKEFRQGLFSECGRQDEPRPRYLRTNGAPPEETPRLPPRTDSAVCEDPHGIAAFAMRKHGLVGDVRLHVGK
jgi:hypothetical protein